MAEMRKGGGGGRGLGKRGSPFMINLIFVCLRLSLKLKQVSCYFALGAVGPSHANQQAPRQNQSRAAQIFRQPLDKKSRTEKSVFSVVTE